MKKSSKSLDILIPFQNKWVILNKNHSKVLGTSKDVGELMDKVESKKLKNVSLMYVLPMTGAYAA